MAWKNPTASELAQHWIASRRVDAAGIIEVEGGHLADFLRDEAPQEEPQLAWDAILLVLRTYREADFYSDTPTEAQQVCGVLSAGPIEDLLSFHGGRFISQAEEEAALDRRIAWALGGVWKFQMTDEVWNRVQKVADRSWWQREV